MQRMFDVINLLLAKFLMLVFAALVLDVLWQVFSRYVTGSSSSFTEEFARFALIWLSVLGAAYLNGQRGHLAMDFLLRKLDKPRRLRREVMIEGLMFLFSLVVMVIGGGNLVYTTLYLGQTSSVLHVPLGLIYAIVPFSGLLIMFFCVYHIHVLKTKVE